MARFLQVLIEVPAEASVAETKEYVLDWMKTGGGCRHPDDALRGGVIVHSIRSVVAKAVRP